MDPTPQDSRLARLREWRNRRERDLSLTRVLEEEQRRLRRVHRAVGGAERAWIEAAPAELAARCEVVRLARGVLTVRVADDSTRFALDRWLRSGGLLALTRATPATLTRVRLMH